MNQAFCLCPLSVLGTLAATYLTIAIIIKYHTAPVLVHIAPLYSSGYVCVCVCVCWSGQIMGFRAPNNPSAPLVMMAGELKLVLRVDVFRCRLMCSIWNTILSS